MLKSFKTYLNQIETIKKRFLCNVNKTNDNIRITRFLYICSVNFCNMLVRKIAES